MSNPFERIMGAFEQYKQKAPKGIPSGTVTLSPQDHIDQAFGLPMMAQQQPAMAQPMPMSLPQPPPQAPQMQAPEPAPAPQPDPVQQLRQRFQPPPQRPPQLGW